MTARYDSRKRITGVPMTQARRELYDCETPGYYHCISRCVRRAFLCGFDRYLGKSFNHRKKWIKRRLKQLLKIFAIDCFGYAVLENHLHTGLHNRPDRAAQWSDEEVARRWRKLFPRRTDSRGRSEEPNEEEISAITADKKLVELYRKRLSDISWFNRCLNENIARRANAEDNCTGRFWEGRFKSVKLESRGAILACCVYIDLNRIRAGTAKTLEESDFTSVQDRIARLLGQNSEELPDLVPIAHVTSEELTEERYVHLVDETGRLIKDGCGAISSELSPILTRLGISSRGWVLNACSQESLFKRVIGSTQNLRKLAANIGKKWLHGIHSAKIVFA